VPNEPLSRWLKLIRPQDFVWILLFAALAAFPENPRDFLVRGPLIALGLAQVLESRVPKAPTTLSRVLWIVVKLVLAYVLMAFSYSINSPYWLMLALPVLSAATIFGAAGTLLFSLLTGGAYLTFLFWVTESGQVNANVTLRVLFLAIVGNLANTLAEDLRRESGRYRRATEQLEQAAAQVQEAEEAVRRSERLAALGQLSAGLAHELRNPLGTIKASAEMLSRSIAEENEVAREMAGFINSEVDRTNSLVTRFLQFARPLELRLEKADLAQTLDRSIALAEREAGGVAIYKNYDPSIPPFPFDAELLERVFYNLVLNAAQATPAGGAITVKTRAADSVAEVAVIDRGAGMAPSQIGSIFNPFFTTKPQGVGLGLAIVSKIVDEHGGKIAVESEQGKGSVFRVFLPMKPG
jgi:two-component system, NtrC family, sensor histidine kinase HydH